MCDHWKYSGPPAYMAVAAYLKMAKPRPKRKTMKSKGAMRELAARFGGAGGARQPGAQQ